MLEYRQNINYYSSQGYNINEQLEQLATLLKYKDSADVEQLYDKIRSYVYRQIKIEQLAVTRILNDLLQIRKKNDKIANIIEYFVANNNLSYSEVAQQFGCSKQYIHQTLAKYCKDYYWLNNLYLVKGAEDSKNQNNRTKFFSGNRKVDLFEQLEMFEDAR